MSSNKRLKLYCCDQEAVYIDMGHHTLQYYFCKACRKEVAEPIVLEDPPKAKSETDDSWEILHGLYY